MSRRNDCQTAFHPFQALHVAEWPSIRVLLAPRTEGWRPSLHYDLHGYVEVDAIPVPGILPGATRSIPLSLDSIEIDFRFWQKCRSQGGTRGNEYRDIGGSGSPRLYSPETMIEFLAPHDIHPRASSETVKVRYPFKATVPCTMFHMTSYEADRFFECTARAWYRPAQPIRATLVTIAGPISKTSRAYMPPHARSHTLRHNEYPEPSVKPPLNVPFHGCPVLR